MLDGTVNGFLSVLDTTWKLDGVKPIGGERMFGGILLLWGGLSEARRTSF